MSTEAITVSQAVDRCYRQHHAEVLASVLRAAGSLDVAEEGAHEAFAAALTQWRRDGVPDNPVAWLVTVARRRVSDAHRRTEVFARHAPLLLVPDIDEGLAVPPLVAESGIPDELLALVFTCCHPALSQDARVALTLRVVLGVPTVDVARALLVTESTMAARLTRAKKKIRAAAIPFRVPARHELHHRLDAVLTVLHLVATTAHRVVVVDPVLADELTERTAGLARTLTRLLPDQPEARGLLALVLLTAARAPARRSLSGDAVLLADQDRSRWDHDMIEDGCRLLAETLDQGPPGRFTLQAAIAAVHDRSPSFAATPWTQVVALYDLLLEIWPTPVVALNRAVAIAEVVGPGAALIILDRLRGDPGLTSYHLLDVARADVLNRLGRHEDAGDALRAALAACPSPSERRELQRRLHAVTAAD